MKIRYSIIALCLLLLGVWFLSACNNDSNLMEMTYDSQDSAVTMTLNGEKYFLIGAASGKFKKNQKIARVKSEDNLPNSYVYTIQGYEGKDFLLVEERTVGVVLCIYAREKINTVPVELLTGNVILDLDGDEYIKFNDKNYYYFSKTSSDFRVDKELCQINKSDKTLQAYKVQGQLESEWIAVKDETFYKEGYLLYWIRGNSIPREYIEIWRTYGR